MRNFIFKVENLTKNPSIYGGRKQQATIYEIKKNKLVKIGITNWNTAGYRGDISSVNEYLLENNIIPKIWSKGYEWEEQHKCRNGMYTPYYHENEKYSIIEI